MLNFLRKNAGESKIIKVFLGMIVIVFIFFGVGVFGSQVEWAVRVNDAVISKVDYDRAYTNLERLYRDSMPQGQQGQIPELIRAQALEQLVSTEVLVQEAQRLGLQVGEDELLTSIAAIPDFQVDGQVNKTRYLEVLALNRMKPLDFEAMQRQQLLAQKVLTLVRAGVHITPAEVAERYHYEHDQVTLRYLRVRAQDFQDGVTFTEEELQAYFDEEKETFREPERAKIQFAVFRPESYEQEVVPDDESILVYYEEHQAEFDRPEEVKARHILFKVAPDADDDTKAAIRARAEGVLARAVGGEDFAQLARDNSEDSTAASGGELGSFRRGAMTKPFEDAAFALEAGKISEIVETEFGLHIILVEEKSEGGLRSLDDARGDIVKSIQKRDSRRIALKRVEDANDKILDGVPLAEVAAELGATVETSPLFARGEVIPPLGRNPEIGEAVFVREVGETSEIMNVENGYMVFEVTDRVPSQIPDLAAIRDRVELQLRGKKASEAAHARAAELLGKIKAGENFELVFSGSGLTAEITGAIGRFGGYIPKLGNVPDLKEAAFDLTPESPVADAIYDFDGDAIIAVLQEVIVADDERFERDKPTLTEVQRQDREAAVVREFLRQLRAKAFIETARGYGELS